MGIGYRPVRLGLARRNREPWLTICSSQTRLGVAKGNTVQAPPTRRVVQTLRRDRSPRY